MVLHYNGILTCNTILTHCIVLCTILYRTTCDTIALICVLLFETIAILIYYYDLQYFYTYFNTLLFR